MGKANIIPERITPDALLTSHQVGNVLQVNPSSINNWVKQGLLKAYRTPGGHRRIRARDLVEFLNQQEMPVPPALLGATPPRVLWVEHDVTRRAHLKNELVGHSEIDARVLEHTVDALVQLSSFRPSVLVMESRLEGVDGIDVCAQLKRLPDTANIEVVIEATPPLAGIIDRAMAAGAALCVMKPVPIDRVLSYVGLAGRA